MGFGVGVWCFGFGWGWLGLGLSVLLVSLSAFRVVWCDVDFLFVFLCGFESVVWCVVNLAGGFGVGFAVRGCVLVIGLVGVALWVLRL